MNVNWKTQGRKDDEHSTTGPTRPNDILSRGCLTDYCLAHSARGEFLRQLGCIREAKQAFEQALALAEQKPERRFLAKKISTLDVATCHD
jgi:predicted RNA polymerase sigma factor